MRPRRIRNGDVARTCSRRDSCSLHGTFVEEFRRLAPEVQWRAVGDRADGVLRCWRSMQGKALNWNCISVELERLNGEKIRSVFDRHDFAFKWTYAEFEGARELYPWCLDQLSMPTQGIADAHAARRRESLRRTDISPSTRSGRRSLRVTRPTLRPSPTGSVDAGLHRPAVLRQRDVRGALRLLLRVGEAHARLGAAQSSSLPSSTDKKNEAVANAARFADAGRRRKELADADYEAKMAAIFAECRRVLRDDGVLDRDVHAQARRGLGHAWHGSPGGRLPDRDLVAREHRERAEPAPGEQERCGLDDLPRLPQARGRSGAPPFFEDLEGDVRAAVRDALDRFSSAGLSGVDLLLSTYGPALSVISSRWPVYSSDADPLTGRSRLLRPEEALDAARAEVVRMQRRRLVGTDAQLDAYTDFELIAWETFKAAEFPFDEARRLALATGGLDVDELARARLVEKKAGTVVLLPPERRVRRGADDDAARCAPGRDVVRDRDRRRPHGHVRRRDRRAPGGAGADRSGGSRDRSALPRRASRAL